MGTSNDNETKKEDTGYDAIANAVSSGNLEDLDRLMAEEVSDEKVEEKDDLDETTDTGGDVDESSTDDKTESDDNEDEQKDDKKEAATTDDTSDKKDRDGKSAASTAKTETDKGKVEFSEKDLHELKSLKGRVPYLNRRLAELERELRAEKARGSTTTQSKDKDGKPTPADLSKVELDPDTQKEIDELKEIDPVVAKAMERIARVAIANADQRVAHAVTTLTDEDQKAEDQRFFMEQKALLGEMIPQHDQIFQSNEWKQWKETLTPGRRALAESSLADEVAQAIYAFAAEMQSKQPPQDNTVVNEGSKQVKEARERKQAASVDTRNPAGKQSKPIDEEALFKEMYNKIGKEQHIL